ncbi:MAG: sel1 repeat family protein [Methylobacteriaceae bacterium]|nr:sel1 repeat family protein [Methylobacteriaceae bacterium]
MPISKGLALAGFLILAPAVASAPTLALDGPETAAMSTKPLPIFKNPRQALREGLDSYRSGNARNSVDALQFAAEGGEPLARWKLGRMYADGDGVTRDDLKAYHYFSQIVAGYNDDDVAGRETAIISSAFVALGVYNLNGIADSGVKPNPDRAIEMFHYAATNFGDANAQYNLGRLYLDGVPGVARDTRQAARWLSLAAEKGNTPAQAILGQMLFNGNDGVMRQRARGLMWLTLARDAATGSGDQWIVDLYESAISASSDPDRQMALAYLQAHLQKRD